ncbi:MULTISPECIES: extensin family protein [Rhizobium/Agrobacterium group]|uniref:Extensin n=1 Tax=Pararhizobium antarcticum TaxID=1798805 RepID=A0A657LPV6_9HYPH|nr:extensin [Pararhizobium antarcticum]OJG00498.1 extensin [Rhizobium sp. 58]
MQRPLAILRPMGILILSLSLATCSTDGLQPSARIDDTSSVGAIEPVRAARQDERLQAYPINEGPINGGPVTTFSDAGNGAAPDTAGGVAMQQPVTGQRRLPMIDSEPDASMAAVGMDGAGIDGAGGQPMTVPSEGVNMDAMLGVDPGTAAVVGLAQEQSLDIAEGNASQPVVGGIGEDEVQQLGGGPAVIAASADAAYDPDLPPLTPAQIADEAAQKAQFQEQQRRVMLRQQQEEQQQQVAFLPRTDNPLSEPEPDFTGRMPSSEISCRKRLKKLGVEFEDVARIAKSRSCGIDYPIELTGLSGGIDIKPSVKLNCQVTEAFAKWVKNELAPSARYRYLSGIKTIKPLGGYSCRTMNSKRGNPMSEHARGNAIDVGKFVLNSGKEIDVRKPGFFAFREKGLLKAVRSDSCKYFSTVLGPGSDASHKDHFHFDLRPRKSGYRHCD